MIHHVVFFRLLDTAEGKSKTENARIIKEGLEGLSGKIEGLVSASVGINIPYASNTDYDLCLHCTFNSWSDLSFYASHPEHLKVAAYIGKCKSSRAACDFEN